MADTHRVTTKKAARAGAARARAFTPRFAPEVRRAHILAVARDTFADVGYDMTSMAAIATAAEVTRGLLYHYFPSKQAIYLAVLDDVVDEGVHYVVSRMSEQQTVVGRVTVATEAYLEFAETHPGGWALIVDDGGVSEPECVAGRRRAYDAIVSRALDVLAGDIADTLPPPADPQIALEFVISGVNGIIRWRREHPEATREEILLSLVGLIAALSRLIES